MSCRCTFSSLLCKFTGNDWLWQWLNYTFPSLISNQYGGIGQGPPAWLKNHFQMKVGWVGRDALRTMTTYMFNLLLLKSHKMRDKYSCPTTLGEPSSPIFQGGEGCKCVNSVLGKENQLFWTSFNFDSKIQNIDSIFLHKNQIFNAYLWTLLSHVE